MRIRKYIACIMMVFLIGASLPVYAQEKNDASSQDIIIDGEEPENNDSENEKSDVENDVLLEDSAGDKEESIVNSNQDNELNEGNGEVSEENKQESERQEEETLATPETDAFAELTERCRGRSGDEKEKDSYPCNACICIVSGMRRKNDIPR